MGSGNENDDVVTVGCSNLVLTRKEPVLQWLIGSPFFPPLTIISTFRCIHTAANSSCPDYDKESEDIRTLLPKGFEVIGALKASGSSDSEKTAREAIDAARRLRGILFDVRELGNFGTLGGVLDLESGEVSFFVSRSEGSGGIERVDSVNYDERIGKSVWERGCLLHCEVPITLPVYVPANDLSGADKMYLNATEAVAAKLKDSQVAYMMERLNGSLEVNKTILIGGEDLDYSADLWNFNQRSAKEDLTCGDICLQTKSSPETNFVESADTIQVSVLLNTSSKSTKSEAPIAEYFPVDQQTRLLTVDFEMNVLCYVAKDLPVKHALSKLVIPGLVDQLNCMKKTLLGKLLTPHPQLRPYHFNPPGVLHPVTVIYELTYGETELKQVDIRRSLHLRLGLPLDRPLLRIANAMELSGIKDTSGSMSRRKGTALLRDVHIGIPSSGVSRGVVSLIQGSYEYHHYLQDGFDDSGWGCAYRSLQTIISWFRLQHYTFIDVPSHREIQQALVEIGDKDPSFIGSRDWIGAIELSFVLDKLLGVSCKIINVRSGTELPEKCRELALHFESQGTPIMIGGGVLAYTLLGVDYNEASGDSAFLILDPHYTGNDEHKKIVNGGWCGWKKAVDSKGKNFFLHDKFYNLLLPQRPNMV